MNYSSVDKALQEVFAQSMPLSQSQSRRIAALCGALLLAGEVALTRIARFLHYDTQQDSRVRWIERLLAARFMTPERVYQPVLQQALQTVRERTWHLVIDRTTLWDGRIDLATISLNYRKRAIPLVWLQVPFGGASEAVYVTLLRRCVPLIPPGVRVVFHGDTEFGGAGMIRALREIGWDFMLAQSANRHFRATRSGPTVPLASLPVTPRHPCQVANVELFAEYLLGGINLLAFYAPHYTQTGERTRDITYLATSLPLTPGLRRLGRRRWGTEPFYRDYKSAGWEVTASRLKNPARQQGLLILLALAYLWSVCLGRWLCKTSQRRQVDRKPIRHLSLFRLGWDWLLHRLRCNLSCPPLLRLYT
jgi:hypothetical protein